ncbi:uncharacterized protein ARMOST_17782 [Armillaria ostoyae]|uniref:Uncharacterized protein n=1 Tax=Armillaria ostoyae TaxID=47428 RepID=A0A284S038_ARMOS|nr:uncharacterized protein ARMOST_17782 [Armillaria ostoyae]
MARHQEEWTRREPRRNKIRHRATTLIITDNIKTQELFACVSLSSFHVSSVNSHQHLIATPTSNASPPTSTSNPHPSIHYASGAIHAKEHITLTAVAGWPPEADIGEWKGTANDWIINLQMEGSSVTPGPKGTTTFKIRNVEVTRTRS